MIQVAVLGYGTVGSGVVEVIEKNKAEINKKSGEALNIKYILDSSVFFYTYICYGKTVLCIEFCKYIP